MLRFTDITEGRTGILDSLLGEAYADLLATDPARWEAEREKWKQFDRAAFSRPEVGRCVFLTRWDDAIAGFGSYDPRPGTAHPRVGHHCIAPSFQRRGFGRLQFDEILRRLAAVAPTEIHAFTLNLPFFAGARRLYETAGFRIIERVPWSLDPTGEIFHYRKKMANPVPDPMAVAITPCASASAKATSDRDAPAVPRFGQGRPKQQSTGDTS